MSDGDEVETPPEGASCGEHPERDALVVCPRCGSYCCVACWHHNVRRCHACLLREPGRPVPWEDPERGAVERFFGTVADALRPYRSAPSFTRAEVRRAVSFALLTFVPIAVLSGVIPYTHTIGFGPSWRLTTIGTPSAAALALDVARAIGLGVLVSAAKLALLAVPYHSLTRAYASKGKPPGPLAAMAYRGWLVPLSDLLLSLMVWGLPLEPSDSVITFTWVASLLPLMLLLASMIAIARMAAGSGPIASFVVVLVPFLLLVFVVPLLGPLLAPWMPDPALVERAVTAEN